MIVGLLTAGAAGPTVPGLGAGEVLRVVASLAAVLLLVVGGGWLTRHLPGRIRAPGRRLRCVESLTIGNRQRLLLIQVGGRRLLIGASSDGFRTLYVLPESAADDEVPTDAAAPDFKDSLQAVFARFGKHP